ncbi:hypothetical protein Q668_18745 [Alcanivorax sp. PN-3]|nr:hypothetical protein Q668_18745 [Alcanivorax sp. PN-3]
MIKRMTYSFKDQDYFLLKIKAVSPGKRDAVKKGHLSVAFQPYYF